MTGKTPGNIGWAVEWLREGHKVTRPGWNGKGMYLWLCGGNTLNDEDAGWQDFVVMYTAQGTQVPWLCSQSDLLATDWMIVEG